MDCLIVGREMLGILFATALLAGFIDSTAASDGLLTVPALMAEGVPPASAGDKQVTIGKRVFLRQPVFYLPSRGKSQQPEADHPADLDRLEHRGDSGAVYARRSVTADATVAGDRQRSVFIAAHATVR